MQNFNLIFKICSFKQREINKNEKTVDKIY